MRIVSGRAGGIRLEVPSGSGVRPTSDRVKESIFAALGDISGWRVADLYAGSGALGLEAASRGAEHVLMVEKNRRYIDIIERNLARVAKSMARFPNEIGRVLNADVESVARRAPELAGVLELVLADPPYSTGPGEFGAAELLASPDIAVWAEGALLVLEHFEHAVLPFFPLSSWVLERQKRYGGTMVSFCRQHEAPGNAGRWRPPTVAGTP